MNPDKYDLIGLFACICVWVACLNNLGCLKLPTNKRKNNASKTKSTSKKS